MGDNLKIMFFALMFFCEEKRIDRIDAFVRSEVNKVVIKTIVLGFVNDNEFSLCGFCNT